MNRFFLAMSVTLLVLRLEAAEPAGTALATPAASAAAWRSLFNGRDLAGWDGDPRMWSVRDGVIHGETTAEAKAEGNTFLICKDVELGDFELKLLFRCSSTNNSGIQYRSKHIAAADNRRNAWVVRGYQHELRNESKLPNVAGFIYDEGGKRGRICLVGEQAEWVDGAKKVTGQLIDGDAFAKLFKLDDWNEVRIVAEGDRIRHFMNGVPTLDFTDAPELALRKGILALQLHAGAPMWVEFKDISLRELDAPAGR
ncbi:MAG: DUF1080 domain-containing protein [Planctomycetia bacterium]|nr:DUF1080 domain-containing protein [Planctomycetia bacterium]